MTPKYTARAIAPYQEQKWIDLKKNQFLEKDDEFKFEHIEFEATINDPIGFPLMTQKHQTYKSKP